MFGRILLAIFAVFVRVPRYAFSSSLALRPFLEQVVYAALSAVRIAPGDRCR